MAIPLSLSNVPDATPYIQYVANSGQTVYPYPFPITQDSDLVVVINGVTQNTDSTYSLSGQGNDTGGNVTLDSGSNVGDIVTLYRDIQIERLTQFAQNGGFSSSAFNAEFNNLYLIAQQLEAAIVQCLQVPNTNNPAATTTLTPAAYAGKYLAFDSNGNPTPAALTTSGTITAALVAALMVTVTNVPVTADKVRTLAEIAASVTPTNYSYSPIDDLGRREGMLVNDSADDTAALNSAISVAAQSVNSASGAVVSIPTGVSLLSSEVTLPNRVRIVGQNKRGSYFQAKSSWNSGTSPWVFHANNGTTSMFDSTLENLSVDCNNIAGLGGVLSDAWQENCGLRRALIANVGTVGVKFQNGYGGASFCEIDQVEIFGGTVAGAIGVQVEQMSASGATFMLNVENASITGGTATMLHGISMVAESLHCRNVHFEVCTNGIYLAGGGNHTLTGVTGATTVTNLVTIDPNFTGTLTMIGCFRNGGTNFINDGRVKQIAQFGAITAGSGYVNGTYNQVPLTGGSGSGATAQVTVAGNAVTVVAIQQPGTGYVVGDSLSASNANLGGSGTGFAIPVFQNFTGVGTISGRDYPQLVLAPASNLGLAGTCVARSPFGLMAWGVFDGTLTGTNACSASQNVLNVQRTGTGRYTVTLANSGVAGVLIPIATCASVLLTVSCSLIGANSFGVAIDNSSTGSATDQNEVKFMVAGL